MYYSKHKNLYKLPSSPCVKLSRVISPLCGTLYRTIICGQGSTLITDFACKWFLVALEAVAKRVPSKLNEYCQTRCDELQQQCLYSTEQQVMVLGLGAVRNIRVLGKTVTAGCKSMCKK